MSKKTAKIAATYFITMLVSLFLIGGVLFIALNAYLNTEPADSGINMSGGISSSSDIYSPEDDVGQTALFIYEPENRLTAVSFILTRVAPAEKKVLLIPLQPDISVDYNGEHTNLYTYYCTKGAPGAVNALEYTLGISIDRYVKMNRDSFTKFSNFCGNITYEVPYNLVYDNPYTGESTVIKKGNQTLDSVTLRKVLTYPGFEGGEETRAKVVGTIVQSLATAGAKGVFLSDFQAAATDILDGAETNMTVYDIEELVPAMQYILSGGGSPLQMCYASGAYTDDEMYKLDGGFIAALPKYLYLE